MPGRFSHLLFFWCCACAVFAQSPADSVALVNAHWQKMRICRGVKARMATFDNLYGGKQEVFIVEVKGRGRHLETLTHDGRELTSKKATSAGAVAAINGTYFDMTGTLRSVCYTAHEGQVDDYTTRSLGVCSNGAVVMNGKRTEIIRWDDSNEQLFMTALAPRYAHGRRGVDVMVSGPLMLLNGGNAPLRDQGHVMSKHPRSGIATKGRRTYLIVVDGRDTDRAIGVTIPEFAHMLRVLGMDDALNLDGGGSSVLWTQPKVRFYNDGTPVCPCNGILNQPSDGQERTVSNSIIVK